jgi:hypothetical protein
VSFDTDLYTVQFIVRRLERVVHDATGVEPRCWHEPLYEWESMETQASSLP